MVRWVVEDVDDPKTEAKFVEAVLAFFNGLKNTLCELHFCLCFCHSYDFLRLEYSY